MTHTKWVNNKKALNGMLYRIGHKRLQKWILEVAESMGDFPIRSMIRELENAERGGRLSDRLFCSAFVPVSEFYGERVTGDCCIDDYMCAGLRAAEFLLDLHKPKPMEYLAYTSDLMKWSAILLPDAIDAHGLPTFNLKPLKHSGLRMVVFETKEE